MLSYIKIFPTPSAFSKSIPLLRALICGLFSTPSSFRYMKNQGMIFDFGMKFSIQNFLEWNSEPRKLEKCSMFFYIQNITCRVENKFHSWTKNKCETFCPSRQAVYWISKLSLESEKYSEWRLDFRNFQNLNWLLKMNFRR